MSVTLQEIANVSETLHEIPDVSRTLLISTYCKVFIVATVQVRKVFWKFLFKRCGTFILFVVLKKNLPGTENMPDIILPGMSVLKIGIYISAGLGTDVVL